MAQFNADTASLSISAPEKRKAIEGADEAEVEADVDMMDGSKRQKTGNEGKTETKQPPAIQLPPLLSVLDVKDITPPIMPTKAEMEGVLLALRKRALLEEYLGDGDAEVGPTKA